MDNIDFLMCSERSGSNLLSRIIGSHPDYCAPIPTHMFRVMALNLYKYMDLSQDENFNLMLQDLLNLFNAKFGTWHSQVDWNTLRTIAEANRCPFHLIYRIYYQEALHEGKFRLFIKENQLYRFAFALETSFPNAKYVYMVRDPRDMALSWKCMPVLRGGVLRATKVWRDDQAGFLQMASWLQAQQRVCIIRYEDLLSSPDEVLQQVCDFLGIAFSPRMLAFYEEKHVRNNACKVSGWENTNRPLLRENREKYKSHLSEAEGKYVETICGDLMKAFGYSEYFGTTTDMELLHEELLRVEPYEKAAYKEISESERRQREKWQRVVEQIASRFVGTTRFVDESAVSKNQH